MEGRVLLGKTITKLGLMCLAQGHNAVATHGHSVSSQELYHYSKSQYLNPENKLLYQMKTRGPEGPEALT